MSLVDTHAHLCDSRFDADREAVLDRARAAGVERLVEIADGPEEWGRALAWARARPERLRCALGLHPYHAGVFTQELRARLKEALRDPAAAALGEIGLDYARSEASREAQREAFASLSAAGREWGLPLVIHCRDAFADLLAVLKEVFAGAAPRGRFHGVLHCFTGTPAEAEALAGLGFALGADGPVTYKKNEALREAFRAAGPERVVLETDSPWLPPQSSRGRRNEPAALVEIAACLAGVWGLTPREVAEATTRNAEDLFSWGGPRPAA